MGNTFAHKNKVLYDLVSHLALSVSSMYNAINFLDMHF